MGEINESDTDEQIIATIQRWLSDKTSRQQWAKRGQEIVLHKYSMNTFVEHSVSYMHLYDMGQRGILFPHPKVPVLTVEDYFMT